VDFITQILPEEYVLMRTYPLPRGYPRLVANCRIFKRQTGIKSLLHIWQFFLPTFAMLTVVNFRKNGLADLGGVIRVLNNEAIPLAFKLKKAYEKEVNEIVVHIDDKQGHSIN